MTDVFTCTEDNSAPEEIKKAGKDGTLMVKSAIGWIYLGDDYQGVKNNCEYKIMERAPGYYWADYDGDRGIAYWDGDNWSVGEMYVSVTDINNYEITE